MVTGIHASISARAADESEQEGKKRITPYWRTLKTGGELNGKYHGGLDYLRRRLIAEGHMVVEKGSRMFVENHEKN